MAFNSVRLRLLGGGAVALVLALAVAYYGLTILFERHVMRTVADELDVHLKQLLAGIDLDETGQLVLTRAPGDPRFSDPLSGLYWQFGIDGGQLQRSRSLWDTTIPLPIDVLDRRHAHQHEVAGPGKTRLVVMERMVSLTQGGKRENVRVAVGRDLSIVDRAVSAFSRDLAKALALLAVVLAAATAVQVTLGLRPLTALRLAVAEIRSGARRQLETSVPNEVQPLVEELNALLREQEREAERSRGRAAELAHGLKTPLAALAADVGRLKERGQQDIANEIMQIGDAMNRHVERELARARLRGRHHVRAKTQTQVLPLVRSLIATIERAPAGENIRFETGLPDTLSLPIDRTDLAEVLGNVIENAARHAASRVRINGTAVANGYDLLIDDDGPGLAPEVRAAVVQRGVQLDERGGAAGLGLAIVQDVLDAYGWRLSLETSDLGGLRLRIGTMAA